MEQLERRLYRAAQVRELDRRAIQEHGISGYQLMRRAAVATWRALRDRWPAAHRLAVLCGSGNNGGDGYEIARLAAADGCAVRVYAVGDPRPGGDAALAAQGWRADGGTVVAWARARTEELDDGEVIVDAVFGTGLSRAVTGEAGAAIAAVNRARARGAGVLAVDIPSGLAADTGAVLGQAVIADLTATFIGNKLGLYTGAGPGHAGHVYYDDLGVPAAIFEGLEPAARLLARDDLRRWLPPRPRDAHKGRHGHVLIVGGDHGMAGAVLMAARACLRAGAGLVSVATRRAHAHVLTAAQPEVMARGVEQPADLAPLLARADVVALGPGLGQGEWGRARYHELIDQPRLVLDADALNLLAAAPRQRADWILTPHPGEAARLLGADGAAQVQADRPAALAELARRYGGYPVLKGAGSLIHADGGTALCPFGNPGMGVGGMGDALTGVIAALWAQGLSPGEAAMAGVLAHALAGDAAAVTGERGLLPSDLIDALRAVVNP